MDENGQMNEQAKEEEQDQWKGLDDFMQDVMKVLGAADMKEEMSRKQKAANELHDMYICMQRAGFTEQQAFKIALTIVGGLGGR